MSKSLLDQAKELLKNIESNPEALKAFQELVKARAEESKHIEMEMSPKEDKQKKIDELSKRIKACMEKMQKESMDKDDKPHLPGTPEDKAHDVAEEGESVKEALEGLKDKSPDSKKEMLSHLRTLKNKSQLRSPENKEAGKEPREKAELEKQLTTQPFGMAEKEEVKKTEKYYKDLVKAKIDVEDKHIEGIAAQNPDFLKNIASHHDLHPELQKVLAGSSDNGVTEALSLNPNATTETLDILSRSNNPNVLHNVGKHPNAHKETQIKLYHHPSVGYDDPDDGIHYGLAQNINLIPELQNLMANQLNHGRTQKILKRNPNITQEAKKIFDERHAQKEAFAGGYNKSEKYYRNLVKSTLEKQLMSPPFKMDEMQKEEDPRKMVESSLMAIHRKANYLQKLLHEVCECEEVPAWIQDKLSSAKTHMTDVMDYIASQVGKGAYHEEHEMQPEQAAEIIVQKDELGKEQIEPTKAPKSKAIMPAAGGFGEPKDGDGKKPKKPIKFDYKIPKIVSKTEKKEQYYKDLVKAVIRGPWGGGPEKPGTVLHDEKQLPKQPSETEQSETKTLPKTTRFSYASKIGYFAPVSVYKRGADDYTVVYHHGNDKHFYNMGEHGAKNEYLGSLKDGLEEGAHLGERMSVVPKSIRENVYNYLRHKKMSKSEQYYRNLVKSTLEKGDIYSFKTKEKLASLPSKETPKEGQPIVRGKNKGITTRKELKEKFSPDIMPEEKDVPGGTDTKKK